jgi:prolyl-tRNA synthetase
LQNSIVTVYNIDDFKQAISNKKIVLAPWGGSIDDEKQLKINTSGVTPRCVFKMIDKGNEKCFFTNKKATQWVYFARAY